MSSEQVLVELECTTLLTFDLEEFHLLTGILELLWVIDADNSREEWSSVVSLDLWLIVEDDASLGFESLSQLNRGKVVFWEVV